MKNKLLLGTVILTVFALCIFYIVDSKINVKNDSEIKINAYQQHLEAMKNGANPSIGVTTLPNDYVVDEDFESHLPLVIIDINNQKLPKSKIYSHTDDGETFIESELGEEAYVSGDIYIVDNDNYDNKVSDMPAVASSIRIKLRGASSQNFEKKQYAIKMVDENGNSRKVDVMGMGENNDWILNISMIDGSLIRNYTSYMYGSALFPGTPDCRYCEVLMKVGEDEYEYEGVYLMLEKIEQGASRLDISDYEPGNKLVSYILCRDRLNMAERQLSTYGNENNLTYGRLSVVYPEDDILDEYAFQYIQNDIDTIDRILYSDDEHVFNTWNEYLDKQSFVDYYIFNSIFRNYDAGNNSTYMYKDAGGKLCMGPIWDYDNACNNDYNAIQIPDYCYFYDRPWFERLVYSKEYVFCLEDRYDELTSGIFSASYIEAYTDGIEEFLGNAAVRDWNRWSNHYGTNSAFYASYGLKDSEGFVVDRRTESFSEEVNRFQKYFYLEEQYMQENLIDLEKDTYDQSTYYGSYFAVLFGIVLFSSIVLISRRKMYR